jgi:PAS domain S-box-containing protein
MVYVSDRCISGAAQMNKIAPAAANVIDRVTPPRSLPSLPNGGRFDGRHRVTQQVNPKMSGGQGTILIVDEDPRAVVMLTSILEGQGYRVHQVDTGELALISVTAQPPELILLDVSMQAMDGFEVCRRLKDTEQGRHVPIIFISASREHCDWAKCMAAGVVDFITKPFRPDELLARVRTHLERGRLRDLESRVEPRTVELHTATEQLTLAAVERQRSELAAHEGEALFRRVANTAPVIIWTSNEHNCVDFCNAYASEFTGRNAEELVCGSWAGVVHPDDIGRHQHSYHENMGARNAFQLEYRIRRADGEYRQMLDKATPGFLPNGQFTGYVGIIIDITDVKQTQERAFAAQNLENLRVLSAGIAHDFNTILGSVLGEADLALSDMSADSPGFDNVTRIVALAKRSASIVRLLSAYAGDPLANVEPQLVNLTSVVQELTPHLKTSVSRKAEIRTNLEPRLPTVLAKTLQIRQVVLNLILNAIEALNGQKGVVTVTTSVAHFSVSVPSRNGVELPPGRYVRLEVSDTGQGMSQDVMARVFDPYYSTKFPGSGLGLAAVQGIIRSYAGAVNVRSTPAVGSTFEVLLPSSYGAIIPPIG